MIQLRKESIKSVYLLTTLYIQINWSKRR